MNTGRGGEQRYVGRAREEVGLSCGMRGADFPWLPPPSHRCLDRFTCPVCPLGSSFRCLSSRSLPLIHFMDSLLDDAVFFHPEINIHNHISADTCVLSSFLTVFTGPIFCKHRRRLGQNESNNLFEHAHM